MSATGTAALDLLIDQASRDVGVLWPIDRSVAVNPLLDRIDQDFPSALSSLGTRLGVDLWPSQAHLDEAVRRDLVLPSAEAEGGTARRRLATLAERAPGSAVVRGSARAMVAQVALAACAGQGRRDRSITDRAIAALGSSAGWVPGPRGVRRAAAELLALDPIEQLFLRAVGWSEDAIVEELARHLARLPGWAAWAKWNDCWSTVPHEAAISRRELLAISLAVDLAWIGADSVVLDPPEALKPAIDLEGLARLERLERAVHGQILDRLRPRRPAVPVVPEFQVVMCIDVRSEPMRRAIEEDPAAETFGFAGFFGVFAEVAPAGERESYPSLPVLADPTMRLTGGPRPTTSQDERVAAGGTLAELTHEPSAMFALAEASGVLGAPWLLARSLLPSLSHRRQPVPGAWTTDGGGLVDAAEGALRGMGLTSGFAPEVLLLGHRSTSANNAHGATLECGACAGHAGGPNAAALAAVLNDPSTRSALRDRGIDIPDATRFVSGEHDTTRELADLHSEVSPGLRARLDKASDTVAQWRVGPRARSARAARRVLDRRSRDMAEVRPEWGLADHAAFIVAPRSSIRGADLGGRCFLHSYDPASDEDGAILASILAAPMVVAQWINAAYYGATVAPRVLGAGDKTLLNPVGDFGVIEGDDPDLRLGLPWQSVSAGDRPVHLPVRLLVAVEAPLDRIAAAVDATETPRRLVEGAWIHLVGREGPERSWRRWAPGRGWEG